MPRAFVNSPILIVVRNWHEETRNEEASAALFSSTISGH